MSRVRLPRDRHNHLWEPREPLMVEVMLEEDVDGPRRQEFHKLAIVERQKVFDAARVDVFVQRIEMTSLIVSQIEDMEVASRLTAVNRCEFGPNAVTHGFGHPLVGGLPHKRTGQFMTGEEEFDESFDLTRSHPTDSLGT